MKKNGKRFISLLCGMVLLLSPMAVRAAEAPYQTYTIDKWGNATPAPDGYLPTRSIGGAQLGLGDFKDASDMFYCAEYGELYIVDSGNRRIVVLDKNLQAVKCWESLTLQDGSEYSFVNPQGIYAAGEKVYIAEMGRQEVVVCDREGQVSNVFGAPVSSLLPDNFNYQPHKVVVDAVGRIYVLSKGVYQGIVYLEQDGSFIKFFGANEVEMTLKRRVQKVWKSILSDKAAATMQAFNPIEYGNLFLGADGYIYATAAGSESRGESTNVLTKLNPLGIDTLPFKSRISILYGDVTVDESGVITLIEANEGTIYQMDENGKLMFTFGGLGNQVGLFKKPVSMVQIEEKIYVLDADKNTITEFELTQFGKLVRTAINLYNEGLYEESIEPWQEVVRRNSNYLLAYTGLGKAYYQLGEYDRAMYYYRLANDRENYSDAYKEASLQRMRDSFGTIVLAAALIAAAAVVFAKHRKKRKGANA